MAQDQLHIYASAEGYASLKEDEIRITAWSTESDSGWASGPPSSSGKTPKVAKGT